MPTIQDRFLGPSLPKYRKHKASGQAIVTLNGRDFYLGPWNTRASRTQYDRMIGEWLAAGRRLPPGDGFGDLSIAELARAYLNHAETYYRKDGQPTGSMPGIKIALRILCDAYGPTPVVEFGPLSLEALQMKMIRLGQSRIYINDNIDRIRRVFKWGVAKEFVPPSVLHGLSALPGLRRGRTEARETEPVKPVADDVVDATIPYLPPVVADMVRFARLTGSRPGEVCSIRPRDVDRTREVWEYRPESHKTQHHGRERIVFIGPQAQDVLRPYLLRAADSFCFSPIDSEAKRKATMRANRKTPVQPSQVDRRKPRPKRKPTGQYDKDALNRAIHRAIDQANESKAKDLKRELQEDERLPYWRPNQLRHSVATKIRRAFGLEAAQVILGHSKADVTQVYAERDAERAKEVVRRIG